MKYHFKYYTDKNGEYYTEGIELKNYQASANNFENLKIIIQDILDLHFNEYSDSKNIFPPPSKDEISGNNIIVVSI